MNHELKAFGLEKKNTPSSLMRVFLFIKSVQENNIKTVLEIGTAIGYSAIMMSSYVDQIITLEKDDYMVELGQ